MICKHLSLRPPHVHIIRSILHPANLPLAELPPGDTLSIPFSLKGSPRQNLTLWSEERAILGESAGSQTGYPQEETEEKEPQIQVSLAVHISYFPTLMKS